MRWLRHTGTQLEELMEASITKEGTDLTTASPSAIQSSALDALTLKL